MTGQGGIRAALLGGLAFFTSPACDSTGILTGNPDASDPAPDVVDTVDTSPDLPPELDGREPGPGCTGDRECDDGDPCTGDTCDTATGECIHGPADEDRDGFPAIEVDGVYCGGNDCDDRDHDVHPGADPDCTGGDNDCDDIPDDDGDSDGYDNPGCGGPDCNDGDPGIHPGAPEICGDDIDQNCDTVADGPWQVIPDVQVTTEGRTSRNPSLAWTGSGFGVAWHDDRDMNFEVFFALLTAEGDKIGEDIRVTDSVDHAYHPVLIWTGSEFGLGWTDRAVRFARLSPDGLMVGPSTSVGGISRRWAFMDLTWTGSEFGVAWEDERSGNNEILFSRLSAAGSPIVTDVMISDSPEESGIPSIAWTGSEYGVAWHESVRSEADVYFSRVSAGGVRVSWPAIEITWRPGRSYYPKLVWTGSEYGLAWSDEMYGNFEIFFTRLSGDATWRGTDVRITSTGLLSHLPDIVWTGSEYGIVWEDGRYGDGETYLARLAWDGSIIGGEVKVGGLGVDSHFPSLVWTGSEFGVAWYEDGLTQDDIFFTRIGFCE